MVTKAVRRWKLTVLGEVDGVKPSLFNFSTMVLRAELEKQKCIVYNARM